MALRGFLNAALTVILLGIFILIGLIAVLVPKCIAWTEIHPRTMDAFNFLTIPFIIWKFKS